MKTINICIEYVLIVFLVSYFFQGVNLKSSVRIETFKDSVYYKKIVPEYFYDFSELEILRDSIKFNGFLVFEFNIEKLTSEVENNNKDFTCFIFFVEDLSDIKNNYRKYYYIGASGLFYNIMCLREDGFFDTTYARILSPQDFRKKTKTCKEDQYKLNNDSTRKFVGENYWINLDNENIGYFIFSTNFETLILKNDLYYWFGKDKLSVISDAKVMLPFENCINIYSIDNKIMYKTNLIKGNKKLNLFY